MLKCNLQKVSWQMSHLTLPVVTWHVQLIMWPSPCNMCMSSVYCVTGLVNYLWPCDLSWGSMWHHMINPSSVCHMISLCNHVTCHWCIMWPETVSHDPTWGQTWCSWRDCDHIWPKSALRHQCLQLQGRRWSKWMWDRQRGNTTLK